MSSDAATFPTMNVMVVPYAMLAGGLGLLVSSAFLLPSAAGWVTLIAGNVLGAMAERRVKRARRVTGREYVPGEHDRITLDAAEGWDLPDDSLDEIVLTGVDVHLERMDRDAYYLGIYVGQGESPSLLGQFWIRKKGRNVIVRMQNLDGIHHDRIPEVEA